MNLNCNPIFLKSQPTNKAEIRSFINQLPIYNIAAYEYLESHLQEKVNIGTKNVRREFMRRNILESLGLI